MKRFDNINVIPLIDVMLVLLAVVLMSASFIVHDSMQLDLPKTKSTAAYQPKEKTIVFTIDDKGNFFIDGTPTPLASLTEQAAQIEPNTPLVIQVDRQTQFGQFIKLVDIFKANQLNNLTFLTDKVQ